MNRGIKQAYKEVESCTVNPSLTCLIEFLKSLDIDVAELITCTIPLEYRNENSLIFENIAPKS